MSYQEELCCILMAGFCSPSSSLVAGEDEDIAVPPFKRQLRKNYARRAVELTILLLMVSLLSYRLVCLWSNHGGGGLGVVTWQVAMGCKAWFCMDPRPQHQVEPRPLPHLPSTSPPEVINRPTIHAPSLPLIFIISVVASYNPTLKINKNCQLKVLYWACLISFASVDAPAVCCCDIEYMYSTEKRSCWPWTFL